MGRRQQSESLGAALDMEEGGLMDRFDIDRYPSLLSVALSSCNPPIGRKTFCVTFDGFVGWAAHQTVFSSL